MTSLEAGVNRSQVVGFVIDAVVGVIRITGNHFIHAAVVGVAQHECALPGFQAVIALDGFGVKTVVGVDLQIQRAHFHIVNF